MLSILWISSNYSILKTGNNRPFSNLFSHFFLVFLQFVFNELRNAKGKHELKKKISKKVIVIWKKVLLYKNEAGSVWQTIFYKRSERKYKCLLKPNYERYSGNFFCQVSADVS